MAKESSSDTQEQGPLCQGPVLHPRGSTYSWCTIFCIGDEQQTLTYLKNAGWEGEASIELLPKKKEKKINRHLLVIGLVNSPRSHFPLFADSSSVHFRSKASANCHWEWSVVATNRIGRRQDPIKLKWSEERREQRTKWARSFPASCEWPFLIVYRFQSRWWKKKCDETQVLELWNGLS